MKKVSMGMALLAGALQLVAFDAKAEATSDDNKIFSGEQPTISGKATAGPSDLVRFHVGLVVSRCDFTMLSRRGPDPEQVAQCEAAVAAVKKHGVAAAPAIFVALDNTDTEYAARSRLYDLLARTEDLQIVEPLVSALARIAMRGIEDRAWEVDMIDRTLSRLTFAKPKERAPWIEEPVVSDLDRGVDRVVAWRLWQRRTAGQSRAQLAATEMSVARADARSDDPEKAFLAVRHILEYEPAEGIAEAELLAGRDLLPERGKSALEFARDAAKERLAKPAKTPSGRPAPSKKFKQKQTFGKLSRLK